MYKIVELSEREIVSFKGKIVQVIDSAKKDVVVGRDYIGTFITSYMWVLTCFVEVE